jgi:hypothetical protein
LKDTTMTTTTKSVLSESLSALSDAIADELIKNIETSIHNKLERCVQNYLESQDFMYTLDDIVKDKLTELVEEHVSSISLRVEVE